MAAHRADTLAAMATTTGKTLREAIPPAVDEVGSPTILATFTVIAALLPMAFVSGLMGPYMRPIPINASVGMLLSLAIALTVTPWLSLKLLSRPVHAEGGGHETALSKRVRDLFVEGRRVVSGGQMATVDLGRVVEKQNRLAARLMG